MNLIHAQQKNEYLEHALKKITPYIIFFVCKNT